ncbi:MAG TPA: zf-HC2 domain-containing protein [Terriglobales bacterium]|nr:zf-HC2 domain-containing protein [Terriglobales bacterium]
MDHGESVSLMAAEKYLLGELSPELREQFEEHFFECPECALDVRAGAALVEHSKVVLLEPITVSAVGAALPGAAKPGWLSWLRPAWVVPVLAVLLLVIGYQNLVTYPKLKGEVAVITRPQILASASLINANTRGEGKTVVSARQGEPFLLFVDIPADPRFSSYLAELDGPAGNSEWLLSIPSEATKDTVPIRVPADHHGEGVYTLVVRGVDSSKPKGIEIGRYPFELQIRN